MGPGATRSTATAAVEAVLSSIQSGAKSDDKLHIARFGTFEIGKRNQLTFRPSQGFLPETAR